jgi:hypothetical protein
MILATCRSVCEIMAKKGIFQRHLCARKKVLWLWRRFLVLSGHMTKGYFLTKQRVNSAHSYETCLFNGQTDRQTDVRTLLNSYLTKTAVISKMLNVGPWSKHRRRQLCNFNKYNQNKLKICPAGCNWSTVGNRSSPK